MAKTAGYEGKSLREDLINELSSMKEVPDKTALKKYVGGKGLGINTVNEVVHGMIDRHDPENRLIWTLRVFNDDRHQVADHILERQKVI